ncbi:hypothetical protein K2X30_01320 [bacterium]|nr:hypothetical protein [bacterium]
MRQKYPLLSVALAVLCAVCVVATSIVSCSSPPKIASMTAEEQVRQDNTLGVRLSQKLEPQLKIKKDLEVSVYLKRIADHLAAKTDALKISPVGVFVVQDRTDLWKNYSIPGIRIYLSAGLLKGADYENEIAALIALEYANVLNRNVLRRVEKILASRAESEGDIVPNALFPEKGALDKLSLDFFGQNGVFSYTEQEWLQATEVAVKILYRAGYDPRGLVSVWQRYRDHSKNSPFETSSLNKFDDRAYLAISANTPLRNPIVRSEAFLRIQKRIRNL